MRSHARHALMPGLPSLSRAVPWLVRPDGRLVMAKLGVTGWSKVQGSQEATECGGAITALSLLAWPGTIRGLAVSGICGGFTFLGSSLGLCGRCVCCVGIVPMPADDRLGRRNHLWELRNDWVDWLQCRLAWRFLTHIG